ncbi:hypothetical protein B0H15DRAFT_955334 [Mycena belliarum]|uniref:Uncharacterized protein n=1 Tax=Mycena belliarum TaxID=1033014 RepID=A0AAD6TRN1_9AGAR|nr:hypothetical protein B0H15DRAFT_955334 [Mycena belliae]
MATVWPPSVTSFSQLEDYLLSSTTVALHNALFGVDFHSPDAVVRVQDETVYTNDDRTPWIATFFGQVKQAARFQGNHRTFFVHAGEDAPLALRKLFQSQLAVLQCPVIQDDDDDLAHGLAPLVDRCTDGQRYTGQNARNLEVHTAHCGGRPASVWTGVPPNCGVQTPSTADETPMAVGDWVLCEGTLHNRWSPAFDDPRQYELLASRVYILPLDNGDEASTSSTLSATEHLPPLPRKAAVTASSSSAPGSPDVPHKRPRSLSPRPPASEALPQPATPPRKRTRKARALANERAASPREIPEGNGS